MKLTKKQFINWNNKAITLIGMSGVGKTHTSSILKKHNWYHYSCDYRIGSHYLKDAINDHLKCQLIKLKMFKELLHSRTIGIKHNLSTDNLDIITSFLGKLGDPEKEGSGLTEFKKRQKMHHDAEALALYDTIKFINQSRKIYDYPNFINDAGGSACEIENNDVWSSLAEHTLIIYIKADNAVEKQLHERAAYNPKPLYYAEKFLDEQLQLYFASHHDPVIKQECYASLIDPNHFIQWIFPKLLEHRKPKYQDIADKYGYTIDSKKLANISDENQFIAAVTEILT